ncbi:hypothetical protein ACER0A_014465 (plasmid) [Haloimpatiens sp. FM7315]|uniref:hypothetical protein n=1 Tax=Haloimpatiens sp. FM7315 TaxID=3298609 RepID=UPI0035A2CE65
MVDVDEILGFTIESNVIEVEFTDYVLEVDLKDLKGMEINKDNLAEVICKKYIKKEG